MRAFQERILILNLLPAVNIAVEAIASRGIEVVGNDGRLPADLKPSSQSFFLSAIVLLIFAVFIAS